MAHALENKIADRRKRLAEISDEIRRLEMERVRVSAEADAYTDALQYLAPPSSQPARAPASSGTRRGISDTWAGLLREACRDGIDFDLDAILDAAERTGNVSVTRDNSRTQLANYVNRGTLMRTAPGEFRLTEAGAEEIGIKFSEVGSPIDENAPPERGGADTEEVTASSSGNLTQQGIFD